MKNECSIVRDLLPLYVEDMVSADTAAFLAAHLETCAACRGELARLKAPGGRIEPAAAAPEAEAMPLKTFRKQWNRKKRITIGATALITAAVVLFASMFLGSGLSKCTDVVLLEHSVSQDGTALTLHTAVTSSMGYVRGFSDKGGGVKPYYLTFYSTFGGPNSPWGAQSVFVLELDETDSQVYFNRADGGYELVLEKNAQTGIWERPQGK